MVFAQTTSEIFIQEFLPVLLPDQKSPCVKLGVAKNSSIMFPSKENMISRYAFQHCWVGYMGPHTPTICAAEMPSSNPLAILDAENKRSAQECFSKIAHCYFISRHSCSTEFNALRSSLRSTGWSGVRFHHRPPSTKEIQRPTWIIESNISLHASGLDWCDLVLLVAK